MAWTQQTHHCSWMLQQWWGAISTQVHVADTTGACSSHDARACRAQAGWRTTAAHVTKCILTIEGLSIIRVGNERQQIAGCGPDMCSSAVHLAGQPQGRECCLSTRRLDRRQLQQTHNSHACSRLVMHHTSHLPPCMIVRAVTYAVLRPP